MELKKCKNCEHDQPISEYYFKKSNSDGLYKECKTCVKERRKNITAEQKLKISEQKKIYFAKNKELIYKTRKIHYLNNKEQYKLYRKWYVEQNKETLKAKAKEYRLLHRDEFNELSKIYFQQNKHRIYEQRKLRKKNDPLFKLRCNIGTLIAVSFCNKFTKKAKKTISILGCSYEEFKQHLEKQFTSEMNWDNYGSYWELDHIKPISLATNEQELIELNHYTNFQPLYWLENIIKGNTWILKT